MDDKKTVILMITMIILTACTISYLTMDRGGRIHIEQRYEVNITCNNTAYEVYLPVPKKMDGVEMVDGTGGYSLTDTEYGRALHVNSSVDTRLVGKQDHYGNIFWKELEGDDHSLSMGVGYEYWMYSDDQSSVTVNITFFVSHLYRATGSHSYWYLDHVLESGWNRYAPEGAVIVTDSYPFFYHSMLLLNTITWLTAIILIDRVASGYKRKQGASIGLNYGALGILGLVLFLLGIFLLSRSGDVLFEWLGIKSLMIGIILSCGFGGSGFERFKVQKSGSEEMGQMGFIIGTLIGIGFFMTVLLMPDIRIYLAFVLILFVLVFGGLAARIAGIRMGSKKGHGL